MKTLRTIAEIRNESRAYRSPGTGRTIGFVPTMGALHQGHLSLVEQCKKENDVTLVSIFVNPAQFGQDEDLDVYPRDLEGDSKLLAGLGVDILFFPALEEIYPGGYATYVEVEKLSSVLCGESRPGHFRGVATVVLKLFNITAPTCAYFGRKDAQQAIVIKKMVTDLDLDIAIRTIPIVRDADGLALSSRNVYLSREERTAALCLPRGLQKVRTEIEKGLRNVSAAKDMLKKEIGTNPLNKIDYAAVARLDSLEEPAGIDMNNTLVAAAVRVGKTRLIDNFVLGEI